MGVDWMRYFKSLGFRGCGEGGIIPCYVSADKACKGKSTGKSMFQRGLSERDHRALLLAKRLENSKEEAMNNDFMHIVKSKGYIYFECDICDKSEEIEDYSSFHYLKNGMDEFAKKHIKCLESKSVTGVEVSVDI